MANIKILTVGSTVYLGTLEKTKTGVIVRDAICLGNGINVNKGHLQAYLKAENAGKLEKEIEFDGQISSSQRPLTDELELEFEILTKQMAQATKLAVPELINTKFDSLVVGR